ncbi:MAG: DUF4124 domain-containing protein [Methyloprofundus sp.]|nr:DUF4124 domain-containing protein [Methyloprofundus sp.]
MPTPFIAVEYTIKHNAYMTQMKTKPNTCLTYKALLLSISILLHSVLHICTAEVYQWTDAQGKQHYSDKSNAQAKPYKLAKSESFHLVKKVYDGDTVLLADGRKIRLLGINTPEVEHRNKTAQVGGDAARKWLTQKILGTKVRLEFDQQKRDKYKRYLAHIFTEQKVHINAELVRLGFASTNVFPPNLKYVAALQAAEQVAESQYLGIWGYPAYQTKLASELNNKNRRGWQRIIGTVTHIKQTRKNTYLEISTHFNIRIHQKHRLYFDNADSLLGKKVEVRGWVHKYKKGYSMPLKHSSALKIIN